MISISASELYQNFDEYDRRAADEPVEVIHADQSRSYLISEKLFRAMMSSYRVSLPVEALSDDDIARIEGAGVQTVEPYNLDDIPEIDMPLFR